MSKFPVKIQEFMTDPYILGQGVVAPTRNAARV